MTTLDERIRRLVADEVATAPEPPLFDAILEGAPASPAGRPRPRTIAIAALAAAAAVVAGAVVVGSIVRTPEHDQVTAGPLAVAPPRQHLLPETVPDSLVLAEAADAADPQPFGPPITTQVFTRSDGALVRLAVDPWQDSSSSAAPAGFQPVTVRGGDGGWRNQTLGYGLLWFRVGATRVVIQTRGLSAGEAIAVADALVPRSVANMTAFDLPGGQFQLTSELPAAEPREVGTISFATWVSSSGFVPSMALQTYAGDAREAWRLLLDGSGELVRLGDRTVLQATAHGTTTFVWVEGGTGYRLWASGDEVAAALPDVLRSLRTVGPNEWQQAADDSQAEMASWPATDSAAVGGAQVSIHRHASGPGRALCLSVAGSTPRCELSLGDVDPAVASVLVDGTWWLIGRGPTERPEATVVPDRGTTEVTGSSQGGSWWFTAPLPPAATTVTFSIGAGPGMNGSCLRPLT
jgi:hypothetical protein